MVDAELRTIEFLMTSDATRTADLPDWVLALLERDRHEELSHELITTASLMYIRRVWPGISFDPARDLIANTRAPNSGSLAIDSTDQAILQRAFLVVRSGLEPCDVLL